MQNSPDSSINSAHEEILFKSNTESLESNPKLLHSQSISNETLTPSQEIRSIHLENKSIEEIEKSIPADQKYKKQLIEQIKKKSMPRGAKLRKIKEIAESPDMSPEEQKIEFAKFFDSMGINVSKKRPRDSSSLMPVLSESLEKTPDFFQTTF